MHTSPLEHYSVMCAQVLQALDPQPGMQILDGTVGGAGHSSHLLRALGPTGHLWGIERDPRTLDYARKRLEQQGNPFTLIHGNFADLERLRSEHGIPLLDGIFLDLGTSMFQLKEAERGFSFNQDGPLDMRMNPHEATASAAEIVNTWSEADLKGSFSRYGEERFAGRIAKAIVQARKETPFTRTAQLADCIAGAAPRKGRLHPATRVFQALRIVVNDELGAIERVIPQAVDLLKPGGTIAIIAFHSLEDRLVKQSFRALSATCICPPKLPICTCEQVPLLTRSGKALKPDEAELRDNPPSRSARLRIARRLPSA